MGLKPDITDQQSDSNVKENIPISEKKKKIAINSSKKKLSASNRKSQSAVK